MIRFTRTSSWIVLGVLMLTLPAAAAAFDAQNANRVDGKHAVSAGAGKSARAGKLVATNSKGLLPNNIIAKAPNAAKLDGKPRSFFAPATHNHNGVPYANVLIVAESGGDFTSIQAALDSVTATMNNPILIYVAPGEYVGMVTLESFADLQGAGPNLTTLRPDTGDAAVVNTAAFSVVSDLSIYNPNDNAQNSGAFASHTGPAVLRDVSILNETGAAATHSWGVQATGDETVVELDGVDIEVKNSAEGQAFGIQIVPFAQVKVSDSKIVATGFGATGTVRGINNAGNVEVNDTTVFAGAVGASTNTTVGIATNDAVSIVRNSTVSAVATDGLNRALLMNGDSPQLHARGSSFFSPEAVIQSSVAGTATMRIASSELNGGDNVVGVGDNLLCLFSYDEDFDPLDAGCAPTP